MQPRRQSLYFPLHFFCTHVHVGPSLPGASVSKLPSPHMHGILTHGLQRSVIPMPLSLPIFALHHPPSFPPIPPSRVKFLPSPLGPVGCGGDPPSPSASPSPSILPSNCVVHDTSLPVSPLLVLPSLFLLFSLFLFLLPGGGRERAHGPSTFPPSLPPSPTSSPSPARSPSPAHILPRARDRGRGRRSQGGGMEGGRDRSREGGRGEGDGGHDLTSFHVAFSAAFGEKL